MMRIAGRKAINNNENYRYLGASVDLLARENSFHALDCAVQAQSTAGRED